MLHNHVIYHSMTAPRNWYHGRVHISLLAFNAAMEEIIRASKWVVGGEEQQGGIHLPTIRACFMYVTTVITIETHSKDVSL